MKDYEHDEDFLFFSLTPQERRECLAWAYRRLNKKRAGNKTLPGLALIAICVYTAFAFSAFMLLLALQAPLLAAAGVGMLASAYVFAWCVNYLFSPRLPAASKHRVLS